MIVLIIMDGWGVSEEVRGNAILNAKLPFINGAKLKFPYRTIFAHGEFVGLPKGQMGNSEVGHLNIGSGRKIRPDLVIINDLIASGGFFKNPVLLEFIDKIRERRGRLHVMGLLSDGGIHSHILHMESLLKMIAGNGAVTTFLHAFLDGRDTEPKVADIFIEKAQTIIDGLPNQFLRTIGGRSWGMDRDKNWLRVEQHYNAIVRGKSDYHYPSAKAAIEAAFHRGETDEFVMPSVIALSGNLDGRIIDGDGVIHFNFRGDRAVQMTRALVDKGFNAFDVSDRPIIDMVTFTMYDEYLDVDVAFEGEILHDTLTEVVTSAGRRVFKIAETEKWAHVTKFFNGGRMEPFPGEERLLIQSPLDVRPHYDMKPEMSAFQIAAELEKRIFNQVDDLIVANFANADMVGHTGNFEATIKAVEAVDQCVCRVFNAAEKVNGLVIVTADHGNAERKTDELGNPATKHTNNPVPFFILRSGIQLRDDLAALQDIAPTILKLIGLKKPDAMAGTSIII